MDPLLKTNNVSISFGGIKAVQDFNIVLNRGELVGLIGPNGAGKTTAFNLLTGVYQPTTGTIEFDGVDVTGMKPYKITQHGIARTFQNIRLFGNLTVLDNVKIACNYLVNYSLAEAILRVGRYGKEEERIEREAIELLRLFKLDDKKDELASNLPYGLQRHLEIARALAARPKLLLLDEPSMGLAPILVKEIFNMVQEIHGMGTTVLLVEQNARMALAISDYAYVLETGHISLEGEAQSLAESEEVRKVYLGG